MPLQSPFRRWRCHASLPQPCAFRSLAMEPSAEKTQRSRGERSHLFPLPVSLIKSQAPTRGQKSAHPAFAWHRGTGLKIWCVPGYKSSELLLNVGGKWREVIEGDSMVEACHYNTSPARPTDPAATDRSGRHQNSGQCKKQELPHITFSLWPMVYDGFCHDCTHRASPYQNALARLNCLLGMPKDRASFF